MTVNFLPCPHFTSSPKVNERQENISGGLESSGCVSGIQHFSAGGLPSRLIIDCLQTVNGKTKFHLKISSHLYSGELVYIVTI